MRAADQRVRRIRDGVRTPVPCRSDGRIVPEVRRDGAAAAATEDHDMTDDFRALTPEQREQFGALMGSVDEEIE